MEHKVAKHAERLGFKVEYFPDGKPFRAYKGDLRFLFSDNNYIHLRTNGGKLSAFRPRITFKQFLSISKIELKELELINGKQ